MRHGGPPIPFEDALAVFLGPDPELSLVVADLDAWHEAHPCSCPALCECEGPE